MTTNPLRPLTTVEREALWSNLDQYGQRDPILVDATTEEILDGWHRMEWTRERGVAPRIRRIDGLATEEERREFALRANTDRRHLTPEEWAEARERAIAAALAKRKTVDPETGRPPTQAKVAEEFNVPEREVRRREKAATGTTPDTTDSGTTPDGGPDARRSPIQIDPEEIRRLRDGGLTQQAIADKFGVSRKRIRTVLADLASPKAKPPPRARVPRPNVKHLDNAISSTETNAAVLVKYVDLARTADAATLARWKAQLDTALTSLRRFRSALNGEEA